MLLVCLFASLPVVAADAIDLTLEEFKMYQHYKHAIGDPRVQRMKADIRVAAIARDAGFRPKELERAIERGEAAGDLRPKCERNLREVLGATELKGRTGTLEVDTSSPHSVVYVQWLNESLGLLEEEASLIAAHAAKACPISSTIQVWAQDTANPNVRVFQALISATAAARIDASRAKDFADTRYIRLFEKVKSVANGDDLSAAASPSR